MKKRQWFRVLLPVAGGILTVVLTMAALLPFLNYILKVEITVPDAVQATATPTPAIAEELLVTAVYGLEEGTKNIKSITVEIFCPGTDTVYCLDIPANTKVTLSNELYKSLQTYWPEIPQYLKLERMADGFSEGYVWTGCNRILSELLGFSVSHYICGEKEMIASWELVCVGKKVQNTFLEEYREFLSSTASDMTKEERWIYYESYQKVASRIVESAAGETEKDGFLLSGKQVKKQLEEMVSRTGRGQEEPQ